MLKDISSSLAVIVAGVIGLENTDIKTDSRVRVTVNEHYQTESSKIYFEQETRKLLSVHILGEGAWDFIHIGQAVMAMDVTMDYFINTVFNYPTLAESYKIAAFDGINRLG
jgi:pyruvate/2-oxoglutarate dehydrogenase complex dihydrolipoamide dehydrogenase (E3) component